MPEQKQIYTKDIVDMDNYEVRALYYEHFPTMDKKLERALKKVKALLDEVKEVFPEAEYFTGSGGFNLLVGQTHTNAVSCNQHLVVWSDCSGLVIGDGDW